MKFKDIQHFLIQNMPLHKLLRLRERYIYTRERKIRVRYVASAAMVMIVSAGFVLSNSSSSFALKGPAAAYDIGRRPGSSVCHRP